MEGNEMIKIDTFCQVCEQFLPKPRVHYGGVTCYSCRAFFRRLSQREEKPCKKVGQCIITNKVRKQCIPCRYKKCLNIGMNPSLVLTDEEKKVRFRRALEKKSAEAQAQDNNQEDTQNEDDILEHVDPQEEDGILENANTQAEEDFQENNNTQEEDNKQIENNQGAEHDDQHEDNSHDETPHVVAADKDPFMIMEEIDEENLLKPEELDSNCSDVGSISVKTDEPVYNAAVEEHVVNCSERAEPKNSFLFKGFYGIAGIETSLSDAASTSKHALSSIQGKSSETRHDIPSMSSHIFKHGYPSTNAYPSLQGYPPTKGYQSLLDHSSTKRYPSLQSHSAAKEYLSLQSNSPTQSYPVSSSHPNIYGHSSTHGDTLTRAHLSTHGQPNIHRFLSKHGHPSVLRKEPENMYRDTKSVKRPYVLEDHDWLNPNFGASSKNYKNQSLNPKGPKRKNLISKIQDFAVPQSLSHLNIQSNNKRLKSYIEELQDERQSNNDGLGQREGIFLPLQPPLQSQQVFSMSSNSLKRNYLTETPTTSNFDVLSGFTYPVKQEIRDGNWTSNATLNSALNDSKISNIMDSMKYSNSSFPSTKQPVFRNDHFSDLPYPNETFIRRNLFFDPVPVNNPYIGQFATSVYDTYQPLSLKPVNEGPIRQTRGSASSTIQSFHVERNESPDLRYMSPSSVVTTVLNDELIIKEEEEKLDIENDVDPEIKEFIKTQLVFHHKKFGKMACYSPPGTEGTELEGTVQLQKSAYVGESAFRPSVIMKTSSFDQIVKMDEDIGFSIVSPNLANSRTYSSEVEIEDLKIDDEVLLKIINSLDLRSIENVYTAEETNYLRTKTQRFWDHWSTYSLGPEVMNQYIQWARSGFKTPLNPEFHVIANRVYHKRLIAFLFEFDDLTKLAKLDYFTLLRCNIRKGVSLFTLWNSNMKDALEQHRNAVGAADYLIWQGNGARPLGVKDVVQRLSIDVDIKRKLLEFMDKFAKPCLQGIEMYYLMVAIILYEPNTPGLINPRAVRDTQDEYRTMLKRHLKKKEPETWRYSLNTVEECIRELHSLDLLHHIN